MATRDLGVRAWARRQFAGADLGDKRRTRRLANVAADIANKPVGTLPPAFDSWAELKAAYRLLEGPEVTFERIVAPHWQNTRQACGRPGQYLMIEDTTSLDFSRRRNVQGLGPIGDGGGTGLYVHSTLAVRVEGWTASHEPTVAVVGLLGQQCWVRPPEPKEGRETRRERGQRLEEVSKDEFREIAHQIGLSDKHLAPEFRGPVPNGIKISRCSVENVGVFVARGFIPRAQTARGTRPRATKGIFSTEQ